MSKRVTMTFKDEQMEILELLAEMQRKQPGDVAKEIVSQSVDRIIKMLGNENKETLNTNEGLVRLFRKLLNASSEALDELERI